MFATRVRERPHIERERWLSARMVSESSPPSCLISISSAMVQASWPLGPFTVTVWPSMVTVTPEGTATVFFPIRLISVHPAKDFAADVGVASSGVRHHATGRRQDRDAQAVLHRLQVLDGRVDAAARLRHATDLDDHRLVVEVLELDLELGERTGLFHERVAADVAFGRQDVEDARAHLRGRGRHLGALAAMGVLDTGDHIADGVVDHWTFPLPARLDETGDQTRGAKLPQGDPAHLQLAIVGARAPRDLAPVTDAGRSGVARQLRELQPGFETFFERKSLIVGSRLERGALAGELLHESLDHLVAVDGAFLGHVFVLFPP